MEMLEKLAVILISSGFRYFIFAGIPFLIFYVIFKKNYRKNRIQDKSPKKERFFNEIKGSMMTIGVISVIASLVLFTSFRESTLVYENVDDYSIWWIPVSVLLSLIIHDTYFYFMHRFSHHKKIYRFVHITHHKSTNPSPWTSYSFDFVEAVLENLILVILVMILPLHPIALLSFGLLSFIINIYGHLGYEIMPRWFRSSFLFKIINTSVYHNLHHKEFNGNYALYFRWWDRLLGTENKSYTREYDVIQERRFGNKKLKRKQVIIPGGLLIIVTLMLSSFGSSSNSTSISGDWISQGEDGKAIVWIYKSKNGKYYGKFIKALDPEQQKQVEEGLKKKGKSTLYILKGFVYSGNHKWKDGTLFAPSRKMHINGEITLLKSGKLKVTGYYMGMSKSYLWTRKI